MTKSRKPKPAVFVAMRGLSNAYVECRGKHFATLNDYDAAREFADILNRLETISDWTSAFVGNGTVDQSRWRIGALIARHFGVQIDFQESPR